MKYFSFVLVVCFGLSALGSDLRFLTAAHPKFQDEEQPSTPAAMYSITAKSHKLLLRIHEPLLLGEIQKELPVLSREEALIAQPYVLEECLKEGHLYFLAGDIYKTKNAWFEGLVVGIPEVREEGKEWTVYLCQIHRSRGKLSKNLGPELGKFFLGYGLVTGLRILSFDPYGLMPLHLRKEEL